MSTATSTYWCYRCSSFITVPASCGDDSPVVCPDCGQQRWSSVVVECNGGGVDGPQMELNGMEPPVVESTPTIEVNVHRSEVESSPTTTKVCAVCLDALEQGDEVRETPCKHTFHSHCIRQWMTHHSSCPMCRHQLPRDSPTVGRERPVVYAVMDGGRRRPRGGGVRQFVRGLF